jgi:asparagine synthase (glutamine-hydrolysing)
MCGLTGFWRAPNHDASQLTGQVRRMAGTLAHRGPDDEDVWVDPEAGLALAFRRLAIIDLTPTGRQPMTSSDGRLVVVYNGEIYNYRDLREWLERDGFTFRGTSDTEVLLAAVARWGVEGGLQRVWGMFAIALWDRATRTLTLARDRIGKKPLYYGHTGGATAAAGGGASGGGAGDRDGVWLFGSELKALRAHPDCPSRIDRGALALFLRDGYVPAPFTIYEGLRKLPPGCFVQIRDRVAGPVTPYWRAAEAASDGTSRPLDLSDEEAIEELDVRLADAVVRRTIADVPLGAFLSGGIDSSVVVALMQRQSTRPVHTFTLGFAVPGYDEAEAAKAVARHLGTHHTEAYVTPDDAREVIPGLPRMFDEPMADSSQIPTYLVSRLARQHVTVALSGDGGDELFGGYNRHVWADDLWRRGRRVPRAVRHAMAAALTSVGPEGWDRVYARLESWLPADLRQRHPGDKVHKVAAVLDAEGPDAVYRRLSAHWGEPPPLAASPAGSGGAGLAGAESGRAGSAGGGLAGGAASADASTWAAGQCEAARIAALPERMMFADLVSYLPDDILAKVDRASMAVSLEVRAPLLDHRLVEWAWRLPRPLRRRERQGKWILRQVLYRYVPRELVERPKSGFAVPIAEWLRGPLRDWAEDLLEPSSLRQEGYLDPEPIRKAWTDHLAGRRNEAARLWTVLTFQSWLRHGG